MVRTQIYLTKHEREGLALLTKTTGMKLSELIREAVNRLIDQSSPANREAMLKNAAGIWKDRDDIPDFDLSRSDWNRSVK